MQTEKPVVLNFNDEVTGMIYGFVFRPNRPAERVSSQQVQEAYQQICHDQGFVWIHVNLNHAMAEKWLKKHFAVGDVFFEEIREGSRSTRIERVDNTLLAVLNDVIFRPDETSDEASTLWLSCHQQLVVTARHKPVRLIERLFKRLDHLNIGSPTALLVHLLEEQEELLEQIVRRANQYVDTIEERLLSHHVKKNRASLGRLRRMLMRFQRLLAPEPTALFRLLNRPPAWIAPAVVQDLRQFAEEFSVVLNDLIALTERIRLLQEEITSRQMEQSNRTLYVLTVITVLALPINIVAGFFGMNVGGIPLAGNHHGFILLVVIVGVCTLLAGWYAFRRSDEN